MNVPNSETAVEPADAGLRRTSRMGLSEDVKGLAWRYLGLPVLVAVVAVASSFAIKPSYTAVARILPPTQQGGGAALLAQQLGSLAGLAGAAAGIKNPADQFVALLKSQTIADRLIDRFKLRDRYEEAYIEDVRRELAQNTGVNAGAKDGVITITFEDSDPSTAAQVANAYVEELQLLNRTLAVSEAAQRRQFFEQQVKETVERLAHAEAGLRSSGVSESTLKAEPRAAVEAVARLRAAIVASEVRVATMQGYLTASNPDLRLANQELAELRSQLSRTERGSGSLAGTSGAGGEAYIGRYRDFKYQEALFEMLSKQLELARLDEVREGASIQVIDRAVPPEKKSWPRRGPIGILSWLVALVLVVLFDLVRKSFRPSPGGAARQAMPQA
jgi:tyrosine-protein kinase Etk/Wzc